MQFALDFAPGMHGHFLEYVLNKYIFGVDNQSSIFTTTGACHPINSDAEYQQNKFVCHGHYTSFDHPYHPDTQKVVFIKHDPELDFVLLTNIYHRCQPPDLGMQPNTADILKLHESMILTGNDSQKKNNWYNKLMERHFEYADSYPTTDLPIMDFDYSSFFTLNKFLQEVKRTADFLEHKFNFDSSLVTLWYKFIKLNQGFITYKNANYILDHIVAGSRSFIDDDWKIHAYLNYKMSKMFGLYDNKRMYGLGSYPASTREIYDIVVDHIGSFDKKILDLT